MTYRERSTRQLIDIYMDEYGRVNKEEAETTQYLVKKELKRRFLAVLQMLDTEDYCGEEEGIYRYLLGE